MSLTTQEIINQILTKKAYVSLPEYFKSIQKAFMNQFFFYQTGVFKPEEVMDGLLKFDKDYQIFEHKFDRDMNYSSDKSSVCIKIFVDEDSNFFYILMARSGCAGARDNLFFKKEKFIDSRLTENSFTVYGYNIRAIETISSDFSRQDWVINIAENYQELLDVEFSTALRNYDWKTLKQSCKVLTSLLYCGGVSRDYSRIRYKWINLFNKFVKKDIKLRGYKLHHIYKLPKCLPCKEEHSKVKKISLWSLLPAFPNDFN